MSEWVDSEYSSASFGDARLDKRSRLILHDLSKGPSLSIPQSCKGWSELTSAYRFFNNPKVTVERILAPHRRATIQRMKANNVVLVVQDTTELDYTGRKIEGLGPLNYEQMEGFLSHTLIAVTPERLCLGVVDAMFWSRDKETFHKRLQSKKKPIEEKESYRWVEGYNKACEVKQHLASTQVVSIADREGDIYECFMEAASAFNKGEGADWIIRSYVDRSLPEKRKSTGDQYKKMKEEVASSPVMGTISFTLPASKKRKKRQVTQTIRATPVTLKAPYRPGKKLPNVTVHIILAREEHPPEGEEPVEWYILTSLPISTVQEVIRVIDYYLCRWQIEIFFKVLKSGCGVEKIQFERDETLLPCLALYMIITWRVLFLMMLGRTCPNLSCTAVFEEDEWQAAYQIAHKMPPPKEPPSLGDMVLIIAQFGGYLHRSSDSPPGPKAFWTGIQCLYHYTLAWKTYKIVNKEPPT